VTLCRTDRITKKRPSLFGCFIIKELVTGMVHWGSWPRRVCSGVTREERVITLRFGLAFAFARWLSHILRILVRIPTWLLTRVLADVVRVAFCILIEFPLWLLGLGSAGWLNRVGFWNNRVILFPNSFYLRVIPGFRAR
jgi:hypothetical protein